MGRQLQGYIMKLNSDGNLLWSRALGELGVKTVMSILVEDSGDIVFTGWFADTSDGSYAPYLGRTDLNGNETIIRPYPEYSDFIFGKAICESMNGGFVIGAEGITVSTAKILLFEVDETGDMIWNTEINDLGPEDINDIEPTPDGGYVTIGRKVFMSEQESYIKLMRFSALGDSIWTEFLAGSPIGSNGYGIDVNENGSIAVIGNIIEESSGGNNYDVYLALLDSSGNLSWEDIYGESTNCTGRDVHFVGEDLLVCGTWSDPSDPFSDLFVQKLTQAGDSVWFVQVGGLGEDGGLAMAISDSGTIIVGGYKRLVSCPYVTDWIVSYSFSSNSNEMQPYIPNAISLGPNYPNPFNPTTTISFDLTHQGMVTLKVFDVTGRLVSTLVDENVTAGKHEIMFDGREQASGIYFARMTAGEFSQTQKMVLIR